MLTVWLVLYAVVLSGLQEQRAQHELYGELRARLAAETVPVSGAIKPGEPVALLDVPKAGLRHVVVVEGSSSGDMQRGPGHLSNTALPGQVGVSAVLGRGVTFGAPFANIAKLRVGDSITATTGQGVAQYVVSGVRHAGDPLPHALSVGQGRLTLVAIVGTGWRSGWAPTETVYVDANLQGSGQVVPLDRPSQVPRDEAPMAGDPSALNPLVLWIECLVGAVVLATWARVRWGGWQVWLVGAPPVLALMWVVTETADRLLPNLL